MGRLLPFPFAVLRAFLGPLTDFCTIGSAGYSQKDIRARGRLKAQGEGLSPGAPRGAPGVSYLLACPHISPRQVCLLWLYPFSHSFLKLSAGEV